MQKEEVEMEKDIEMEKEEEKQEGDDDDPQLNESGCFSAVFIGLCLWFFPLIFFYIYCDWNRNPRGLYEIVLRTAAFVVMLYWPFFIYLIFSTWCCLFYFIKKLYTQTPYYKLMINLDPKREEKLKLFRENFNEETEHINMISLEE